MNSGAGGFSPVRWNDLLGLGAHDKGDEMNWFRQHIPTFVDVDESPQRIPFETLGELLNLEVLKWYGQQADFSHFAISDNCLMEISAGGLRWWVVGYLGDPAAVDLPQWDGGKYKAEMKDGTVVDLSGAEVKSSCGDVLTLRDGTTAKNLSY